MHKRSVYIDVIKNMFVLLLFACVLISCQKAKVKSAYTIGFSQCVGSDLWRRTMLDEMKMELSLHPGVKFVYADAQNRSVKQIAQVHGMLNAGIDLLVISPNEAQPLTPVVEEAYNKGIPVIIIDRKTASSLYTAYVGGDNYALGRMAGEYIGSSLKGKISVLEVMGLPGSSPAIERDRGFNDGIGKFPNVHVTAKVYGDWLKPNAEQQLFRIKDQLLKVDAVFAHNDVMASGVRDIFNQLNISKQVKLVGVDALPGDGGGLEMIAGKVIDASVLYPTGGKEAIVTAFRILNKEQFSRENILQSLVIDSSNVQLMKMQWSRIKNQQKDIEKQQGLISEQQLIYENQQIVLNIIVITLVLAIIFGGLAFYWLMENRKINKSLAAKNDEILSQRNQLIEMSVKAEAATEAKLNFFTNVSHEFRTPLTLIISPLQDLMRNEKIMAVGGKNMQVIYQNSYRLLRMVNQLIDYRKIEYDKQLIKASENNLVPFVREIAENFRLHAQKLHIHLSVSTNTNDIKCWFDANMLDKVLFNLIGNAIKFNNDKGKVKINIIKRTDDVIIEVEDTGVGMNPEEMNQVFDQFYQATHMPLNGSGIGLALSKEIIKAHHGSIEVQSEKWKGSKFTVVLPLGDDHLSPLEKTNRTDDLADLGKRSEIYSADLKLEPALTEIDPLRPPMEFSILIVEDNQELLQYLSDKFNEHFDVYVATNGNDAIIQAYECVPDIILSDVVLPGLSGKTISERLKTDIRTSHIPIILLTAQGSIEQQISGIDAMADLYITKPFNFDYLLANVKNLIRSRRILKDHFTSDISTAGRPSTAKSIDKKFINDFSGIVEQNLANDKFSVDDICKLIGVSRVQLYRKVKALLGCSITDYILNRRLKKAKYLLQNEDLSIAEITYLVGFSNPNYFATVFKAKYGCTPTEFKRNSFS
ncbi:substrate-binding domain-containing protein [Mucilaginibacter aquaedulcis]|uniref:substrate-binding domain-containing protein n=1 Tax=Mucilaginibacter aquaedulcis TaxID=1187081 RepID=UPI0025B3BE5A|nr:substrate-binding domain-containing protein [Mucilaginibacter aquaedulcis]MDN3549180.1 substrate-binding domain-containing protein [Mucilaginibacter aquaedulcis]